METKYKYQLTTDEFSRTILLDDLENVSRIFKRNHISSLRIHFGYAWGEVLNHLNETPIDIDFLLPEILMAEEAGHGELGDDDLEIVFDHFILRYCHHGDIHLLFTEKDRVMEEIVQSWQDKDWVLNKSRLG